MNKVPDILPHALYGNICFLSYIKLNLFIHTLSYIHLKLFTSVFNEYFLEYFLDQWVFLSSWLQVIGNQNASCADSFLLDTSLHHLQQGIVSLSRWRFQIMKILKQRFQKDFKRSLKERMLLSTLRPDYSESNS